MLEENGREIITNKQVGVLLPLVFRKPFDYQVPEGMEVNLGDYVRVNFGNKSHWGVVWGKAEGGFDSKRIKTIELLAAHIPPMNESMRKFIEWVSWYSLAPLGMVLKMALSAPQVFERVASDKWQVASHIENIKLTPSRMRIIAYLSDGIARTIKEIAEHAKVSSTIIREFIKAGGLKEIIEYPSQALPSSENLVTNNLQPATYLSPEQRSAAAYLQEKLNHGFSVSVLDGVTGSGKTEVYFDAIERTILENKQVLIMLPEIALSIQWLARFKKRFGFDPAVWHSSVKPSKKRKFWQDAVMGGAKVVVGARSALFIPFKNLGLIIVDEEHDPSYKQEDGVIYQARDMAVARAHQEKIPIVLVSATPSLETEYNIEHKRYERVHLPNRHNEAEMPVVSLIDMRKLQLPAGKWISETLRNELLSALTDKNQSMIFMNRRGYAPLMLCRTCGHRFQCPDCTAWLVLHKSRGKMICHHCGHMVSVPKQCLDCKTENSIVPYGPGVERIAEELRELFPNARIAVMTSDSILAGGTLPPSELRSDSPAGSSLRTPPRAHDNLEEEHFQEESDLQSPQALDSSQKSAGFCGNDNIINAMINGEIDILVGTQMIAKGHHFAGLALVGVIDADMGLAGGDLRAGERTYQLLHQLSGRAGREKTKGHVFLQTYMPEHPIMQALAAGKRDDFMQLERQMREDAEMPPYGKLAAIIIEGQNEQEVASFARELVRSEERGARERNNVSPLATRHSPLILGPAPAPMQRLSGRFRYRILIKAERNFPLQNWLSDWLLTIKTPSKVKIKIDVEPYSFI